MAFACLSLAAPATAQRGSGFFDETNENKVRVSASQFGGESKPGEWTWIEFSMDIDAGWHTYGPHQNDTGFATIVDWTLPAGFKAGESTLYPVPHRHPLPGDILDHIYEEQISFFVPMWVPEGAPASSQLAADLEWLVCDDEECISEIAELNVVIRTNNDAKSARPEPEYQIFDGDSEGAFSLSWQGTTLIVELAEPGKLEFIPESRGSTIENLLEDGRSENGRLELTLSDPDLGVVGILKFRGASGNDSRSIRIDLRTGDLRPARHTPKPDGDGSP